MVLNFPAKTLNLQPLTLKTNKHKANKAKSSFPSIDISGEIKVIDLRVNTVVACEEILDLFKSLIAQKGVDVSWDLLDGIAVNDFERIKLERSDRVLILLDQEKGIEDDRYPLTKSLVGRCAVQHINVNPHDVTGDPVEKRLLIESKRDDGPDKAIRCV